MALIRPVRREHAFIYNVTLLGMNFVFMDFGAPVCFMGMMSANGDSNDCIVS